MDENNIKISLPTEVELFGTIDGKPMKVKDVQKYGRRSKVFKRMGASCKFTDYTKDTSKFTYHNDSSSNGTYFIESDFKEYKPSTIAIDNKYDLKVNVGSCTYNTAIRPILTLSDSKFEELLKKSHTTKDGIIEVEFGTYPQKLIDSSSPDKKIYEEKHLKRTGMKYTYNDYTADNLYAVDYSKFSPNHVEEITYNGKNYVYKGNKYYEVLPIIWIIDKDKKQLICKNAIISGIPYYSNFEYYGPHDDYVRNTFNINVFLNKYLLKEIIQSSKSRKIDKDTKINEKDILEKEILEYLSKYKSKKLNKEFELLNDKYSNDFNKKINESKNINIPKLTLETKKDISVEDIYKNYIKELKDFLEELKSKEKLFNIIEEIDKCINYVNDEKTNIEDAFYKDINSLLELYKSLDKELSIKNKKIFIEKLNKEIKDIQHEIDAKKSTLLSYSNIEEWKTHFRNELQILILNFKDDYDLQCVKHTIDSKKSIIENFKGNKYEYVYREYTYLQTVLNDIKDTIIIYEEKYNIDFSNIKNKLVIFNNLTISYDDDQEILSKKIFLLLNEALRIQSDVYEMTEPYKYEINDINL